MFNPKEFMRAKHEYREEDFEFEPLNHTFRIRGLTGEELAAVNQIVQARSEIEAIIDSIAQGDAAEAFKKAVGTSGDVPVDFIRRIEYLKRGVTDTEIAQEVAVKLFRTYPVDIYKLTNRILKLTGKGMVLGE